MLWVIACLSPVPGATQEKATRISLGYSSISGSQAILRVIKDAGIFSKNGLDASLVLIAGGSGIIQALIAGDLPIAIVSGEPSILARLQGADTVILGGLINIIDFSIITAPEIKKPQDLKGKKLGVSRFGSSTGFVVRYALDKRFSRSAVNPRASRRSRAAPCTAPLLDRLPISLPVSPASTKSLPPSNSILPTRIRAL